MRWEPQVLLRFREYHQEGDDLEVVYALEFTFNRVGTTWREEARSSFFPTTEATAVARRF